VYKVPVGHPGIVGNNWGDVACSLPDCEKFCEPDAPMPVCLYHAKLLYAYFAQHLSEVAEEPHRPAKPIKPRNERVGRVYFIRRRELIKIGWSSNPKQRLSDLDGDALLFHVTGTMKDEAALHRKFAAHQAPEAGLGSEWFHDGPEIRDYIAQLRKQPTRKAS
jgi:hypothetical protein